jgi:hypothetical protein
MILMISFSEGNCQHKNHDIVNECILVKSLKKNFYNFAFFNNTIFYNLFV